MSLSKFMFPKIIVFQKESFRLRMTIRDSLQQIVDVSSSEIQLTIKEALEDTTFLVTKSDSDFDKSEAIDGVVYCHLTDEDLDLQRGYYCLLKVSTPAGFIKKGCFVIELIPSEE